MTRRYYELDVVKAAAIVAVVLIHSTSPFWVEQPSVLDAFVGHTARFAVPAFLAVSGFLYHSLGPIPLATILQRLRRVLLPYATASLLAYAFSRVFIAYAAATSLLEGLLLGAAFGPYYYVFILVQFIGATWILSRLPQPLIWLCFLASAAATVRAELSFRVLYEPFWTLRRADTWALWFMLGWMVAAYRDAVFAFTRRHRLTILVCWSALLCAWSALFGLDVLVNGPYVRLAELVLIVANLMGLFALKTGTRSLPRMLIVLSDWSYAIYLLHPFFIYALQDIVERRIHPGPSVSLAMRALAGLVGAVCLTYTARRVLGRRSRDVVGA